MNSMNRLSTSAVLAGILMLTGCCSTENIFPPYAHQRQGEYLYLLPDRSYTSEVPEKWVTPALLERKDREILALIEALERIQQ